MNVLPNSEVNKHEGRTCRAATVREDDWEAHSAPPRTGDGWSVRIPLKSLIADTYTAVCLRMIQDPPKPEDLTSQHSLQVFRKIRDVPFRGRVPGFFTLGLHRLNVTLCF